MLHWLAPTIGSLMVLAALLDVYLTTLYARSGSAIVSEKLIPLTWRLYRQAARALPRLRNPILAAAGPTSLVLVIGIWVSMLMVGFALIVWPVLGTQVSSSTSPTPRQYSVALYYSGGALTTSGGGDLVPRTPLFRTLYVAESAIGICIITLTLTFLVQVYEALLERNAFALKLHHGTGGTGDAAELVAACGAGGKFDGAHVELGAIADELMHLYESHHFHPSLLYFRFHQTYYAFSRIALVSMDVATLTKAGLDDQQYVNIKQSAAITQMWSGGLHLLRELARLFLPCWHPQPDHQPDEAIAQRWRRRYRAAIVRFKAAGIQTVADEQAGEDSYVALRQQWDALIIAFAHHMEHPMRQVDPTIEELEQQPDAADQIQSSG
jgi:hypothetical protein